MSRIDLTGKTFGYLFVVAKGPNQQTQKGKKYCTWECLCTCGNRIFVKTDNLTRGITKSCGCYRKMFCQEIGRKNHKNLVGKIFGEWTVLERTNDRISKSGIHAVQYKAICSCGKVSTVLAASLLNGESTNCGHLRKELLAKLLTKDLTGKSIGEWTVLYKVPDSHPVKWHCVCSCGIEKDVFASTLVSSPYCSCGHLKTSNGERKIKDVLEILKIKHLFDCEDPELTTECGKHLRLDFQLFNDTEKICIIEFQGAQHFNNDKGYHGRFGKQQREVTDEIKRNFYKKHNFPFYEIRYDEDCLEKLTQILLKHNFLQVNTVPSLQETA